MPNADGGGTVSRASDTFVRHLERERTEAISRLKNPRELAAYAFTLTSPEKGSLILAKSGREAAGVSLRTRMLLGLTERELPKSVDLNEFVKPELRGLQLLNSRHHPLYSRFIPLLEAEINGSLALRFTDYEREAELSGTDFVATLRLIGDLRTGRQYQFLSGEVIEILQLLDSKIPKPAHDVHQRTKSHPLYEAYSGVELNELSQLDIRALLVKFGGNRTVINKATHVLFDATGYYLLLRSGEIEFVPASDTYYEFFKGGASNKYELK